MNELKDKTVKELVNRLNAIMIVRNKLDIEYNQIVEELWRRIPSLKGDANLELKEVEEREKKQNEGNSFKR